MIKYTAFIILFLLSQAIYAEGITLKCIELQNYDTTEAKNCFQELLKSKNLSNSDIASINSGLGVALLELKKPKEAIKYTKKAYDSYPDNKAYMYNYAVSMIRYLAKEDPAINKAISGASNDEYNYGGKLKGQPLYIKKSGNKVSGELKNLNY